MGSLAYIPTYTPKNSVGGDPNKDYEIGVSHGVVGCGLLIKKRDFHWFTIINRRLIYNGQLGDQIHINPWEDSGRKWYVYKVKHHHDLGELDAVLTAAGVDRSVLPSSQNRWVKNPEIQKLIDYAILQICSTIIECP